MKIFGTGLQRTGTMSLTTALKKLGVRARQFPKELYPDIDHPIVNEFDAFTDFPIPLLYQALDRAFPGSKFIHTIRDEQNWLNSVRWLFTTGSVKFNTVENTHAQTFHKAFYGTTQFEEALFLRRFREYNAEVAAYFAGRPDDFLIINLAEGDGYEKICGFLGLPVPDEPFPYANKSEGLGKVRFRKFWWRAGKTIRRQLRESRLRPFMFMSKGAVSPIPLNSAPVRLSCNPFFILTTGRSGSTLLRAILNEHPSLCIPPESHRLTLIVRDFLQTNRYLPWSHLAPLVAAEFQKERGFAFWNMELAPFFNGAANTAPEDRNLAYLIDLFYNSYIQIHKPEAVRWGDKSVKIIPKIAMIDTLFPNAQYIHIYRDGRDVAASLYEQGLYPNPGAAADHWVKFVTKIQQFGRRIPENRFLEISYEKLVCEPEQTVQLTCRFLGVDYLPRMLNYWQNTGKLGDTNRDLHHRLKKPIDADAIGRWRETLNVSQQAIIQERLTSTLAQLGYE